MKTIKLTKGYTAKVCDCHYDIVKDFKWHYNSRYAMRTVRVGERKLNKIKHVMMHHLIVGFPDAGLQVDHINRDSLDNRCENLRIVTPSENMKNRGKWYKSGIRKV